VKGPENTKQEGSADKEDVTLCWSDHILPMVQSNNKVVVAEFATQQQL